MWGCGDKRCIHFRLKIEGKRQLERRGLTWRDNIKMDLKEIGCEYMN
jgi:hypothetical protein